MAVHRDAVASEAPFEEGERPSVSTDLAGDVYELLEQKGTLTKSEIDAIWTPTPEEYRSLQQDLRERSGVKPGPKKVGGFVIRRRHVASGDETIREDLCVRTGWETTAARRLTEVLSYDDLEGLLGQELAYTVRLARRHRFGDDRRGTKEELASALVVKHHIDLFQDTDVRELVGRRCSVKPPARWHAGKQATFSFVAATGFPKELAGVPSEDRGADFEYLEGRFELNALRDFQQEVQRKTMRVLNEPNRRAIVTLPTGAGKTRVAVDSLKDWLTGRHQAHPDTGRQTVLWLAHTEELCDQAYNCFKQVWAASSSVCRLLLVRFWGRYTHDLVDHGDTLKQILELPVVLVSTPQRIINLLDNKVEGAERVVADLRNALATLVVDEAHRAAAPSYRRILDLFVSPNGPSVIGLTATPFRMEYGPVVQAGATALQGVFHEVIEASETLGDQPRERLQALKILARPRLHRLETHVRLVPPETTDLDKLTDDDIERIDFALRTRVDRAERRMKIFTYVNALCSNPENSILYFGPSISDAEHMAFLLRQVGRRAAVVSGNTRDGTRREIVKEFKDGSIQVLCNCEVLTTGFDAPKVTHIVVARPTVSQVLYEQMVGRGLRGEEFGGTADCVIVNCEDDYRARQPELGYMGWRRMWNPTIA